MIKAIAIDDQLIALKVIENFCSQFDFITLEKTFDDPQKGLKHLNKFPADLVFLDIDMPGLTGLELAKKLRQDTMVIFTTSLVEHAIDGFNLNAIDYLAKPFTFERFQQAINKAKDFYNFQKQSEDKADNRFIYIRADYSLVKIPIADITYIEGLDDYLKINIQGQKTVVARMTMKAILEKLPEKQFARIHRSFIVAMNRIEKVRNKMVTIDGKEFPIGATYETDFMGKLG